MTFFEKYIKDEESLYNGKAIRNIILNSEINLAEAVIIISAYSVDVDLANKILGDADECSQEILKYLGLLTYGFAPDFTSTEDMNKYLSDIFGIKGVKTISAELINRARKVKTSKYATDMTTEEIYDIASRWGSDSYNILESYGKLDVIHDSRLMNCNMQHAKLIANNLRKASNEEDKSLYNKLDCNADLKEFKEQINAVNSLIQLRVNYYSSINDPEFKTIMDKYSNNPTVLKNLLRVKNIQNLNLENDLEESNLIANVLDFKLADIVSSYMVEETEYAIEEAIGYCMKTKKPIVTAEDMSTKVSRLRAEFPFLKTTLDRLEAISLKVCDGVIDQAYKTKQEKEKARKEQAAIRKEASIVNMKQEALSTVKDFVNQYTEATISATKYCAQRDIDINLFHKFVEIVGKYDEDLYLVYKDCAKRNAAIAMQKMVDATTKVIEAMKNKRGFSLYDYYSITKFDPSTLVRIAKYNYKVDDKDLAKFKRFYSNKTLARPKKPSMIRKGTYTIKNRKLTKDEVNFIITYMKKNRYPYYESIFMEIARQYVKGDIVKE